MISLPLSPLPGSAPCAAGVCPFPLAMQQFCSFVSYVTSLLLSPRFGACRSRCPVCLPLSPVLSAFLLVTVSASSPFCFRHCVVSLCLPSCFPSCWSLCPPCLPSCWSLCPPCLLSFCFPSCWSLCPPCLPSVSFCLPSCLCHYVRLVSFLSCRPCLPSVSLCLRACLPACGSRCPPCLPSVSFCLNLVYLLVSLLVGHCVRLVSLLFSFVSGLVSLLVGHCVRLVPLLIPRRTQHPRTGRHMERIARQRWTLQSKAGRACKRFSFVTVSALSPFCLPLSPVLSPSRWSLCPPSSVSFVSVLVSLLVARCQPLLCNPVHLSPSSGLLCPPLACNPSHLCPSSGLLCPPLPCNPLHVSPSSGLLCRPLACNPSHLSPSSLLCPSGLLCPPLPCNPLHVPPNSSLPVSLATLHICLPACSALQSFTCVSQLSSSGLHVACNPVHLSPSAGLLCPPLPCNPLHLSSQSFASVSQL